MLTDYQISRIRAFTDSVRAGATEHPERVLLEVADLLDDLLKDEMNHREQVYRIELAWSKLAEQSYNAFLETCNGKAKQ